jgi:hypothetical protein
MPTARSSLKFLRQVAGSACFATVGLSMHSSVVFSADCTTCNEASCSCPTIVADSPAVRCLENGLFDRFNRFADRLSRSKSSCTQSDTKSCDGVSCEANCGCEAASEQLMPHYSPRTRSGEHDSSTTESPVEMPPLPSPPVPMPVRTQSDEIRIIPAPKAGNPFMDEARSKPMRSHLPSSISYEEVHVTKMNRRLAELMNPSRSQAIAKSSSMADEPNVITASGNLPIEAHFAR